jgi:uncharacterized membrane protein YraQ (UPF0718 family)
MSIVIGTILLWGGAAYLLRRLWRNDRALFHEALSRSRTTFLFILPRVAVGLIGSGFLAELLPEDHIGSLFGYEAGFTGVMLATFFGAVTPGGPFVAFAIGAAALKAGASEAALVAYVTSWSVFCLNRSFAYELPILGARFMTTRWALSLPVPFLIGSIVMLLPA